MLKDILAFTNAFRRTDAYILAGVEEIRGGRSEIVGVESQLDDAKLQQFVNSKTQRPITFSYREATHDGHAIGIIHIPIQSRPVYAKDNYGKVLSEKVYLRRGSSTDTANPDEIARMGTTSVNWVRQPFVELNLVERKTGISLGDRVSIADIPDREPDTVFRLGNVRFVQDIGLSNSDFFRDFAVPICRATCFSAALELQNTGGVVIHDTRLVIELHDPEQRFKILTSQDRPEKPKSSNAIPSQMHRSIFEKQDVFVFREGEDWKVECTFGKIQPGAAVRLQDDVLIGCRRSGEAMISGLVYSDNISSPIPVRIHLLFQVGSQLLSIEDIQYMAIRSPKRNRDSTAPMRESFEAFGGA